MKLSTLTPLTLESELQHAAFITHAVPAERVRRHLPPQFQLETFLSERGEEMAFVTVGCFRNRGFHWSVLQYPRLNFEQITYRTYVRYKDRVGVFFFSTVISSIAAFGLQRMFATSAVFGKIRAVRKSNLSGYQLYRCQAECSTGQTNFEITATGDEESLEALKPKEPFFNGAELAQHLSYRLHGFIRMPTGIYGDQIVAHRHFKPRFGYLRAARFDFWRRLGILNDREAQNPFLVIVEPSIIFRFLPPLPISMLSLRRLSSDDLRDLRTPSERDAA